MESRRASLFTTFVIRFVAAHRAPDGWVGGHPIPCSTPDSSPTSLDLPGILPALPRPSPSPTGGGSSPFWYLTLRNGTFPCCNFRFSKLFFRRVSFRCISGSCAWISKFYRKKCMCNKWMKDFRFKFCEKYIYFIYIWRWRLVKYE